MSLRPGRKLIADCADPPTPHVSVVYVQSFGLIDRSQRVAHTRNRRPMCEVALAEVFRVKMCFWRLFQFSNYMNKIFSYLRPILP